MATRILADAAVTPQQGRTGSQEQPQDSVREPQLHGNLEQLVMGALAEGEAPPAAAAVETKPQIEPAAAAEAAKFRVGGVWGMQEWGHYGEDTSEEMLARAGSSPRAPATREQRAALNSEAEITAAQSVWDRSSTATKQAPAAAASSPPEYSAWTLTKGASLPQNTCM